MPLQSQKWEENNQSIDAHIRVLSVRVGGWEGMQCQKGTVGGILLAFFSTDNTSVYIKFSSNTLLPFTKLPYTHPLDEARNFIKNFLNRIASTVWDSLTGFYPDSS